MTTTYENEVSKVDSYFGNCPKCRRTHGCRSIGPDHWYVCHTHRTKWCVGSNLFSTWKELTDVQHFENARLLGGYTEVRPVRPSLIRRIGFDIVDRWRRLIPPTKEDREIMASLDERSPSQPRTQHALFDWLSRT